MNLKSTPTISGQKVKVDFGIMQSMSDAEKQKYDEKIKELEKKAEALNEKIDALRTESNEHKEYAESLEKKVVEEYNRGIEVGKDASYNQFWDRYQSYGNRTDYSRAFAGVGWTENTFNPKHPLKNITSATRMFDSTGIKDLSSLMIGLEKHLNLYGTTKTDYMFNYCDIVRVPDLDLRTVTNMEYMFYRAEKLEVIDELILSDEGDQELGSRFFYRCLSLNRISIRGVIGCDFDIRYSPLNDTSILNIVDRLSDTATGKTAYFSKSAVNSAFETSKGANNGSTSEKWLSAVASKPNWTITTT